MFFGKSMYRIVPRDEFSSSECIDHVCIAKECIHKDRPMPKLKRNLTWLLVAGSLILNIALGSVVASKYTSSEATGKVLSFYPSKPFETHQVFQNGTIWSPSNPSWTRMAANPENEAIWNTYDSARLIALSRSDVLRIGKDPEKTAQFPKEMNVPDGSYIGFIDIFHKFHCLHMIGSLAMGISSDSHPMDMQDPFNHDHVTHCIDMLAQELQCNANLDVSTYTWMDTQKNAFPDFALQKTCTNWDQFKDWTDKHTIGREEIPHMERPHDFIPVPADDRYYELYGFGGSVLYPHGKGYVSSAERAAKNS